MTCRYEDRRQVIASQATTRATEGFDQTGTQREGSRFSAARRNSPPHTHTHRDVRTSWSTQQQNVASSVPRRDTTSVQERYSTDSSGTEIDDIVIQNQKIIP